MQTFLAFLLAISLTIEPFYALRHPGPDSAVVRVGLEEALKEAALAEAAGRQLGSILQWIGTPDGQGQVNFQSSCTTPR